MTEIEYVKMWEMEREREKEKMREDEKLRSCEEFKMICADVKIAYVDVKMIRLHVKMRRHVQKSRDMKVEFVTHPRLSRTHTQKLLYSDPCAHRNLHCRHV